MQALQWQQAEAADEARQLAASVADHERSEAERTRRTQSARVAHARDLELQIVTNAEQRAQQRREELEHNDRLQVLLALLL